MRNEEWLATLFHEIWESRFSDVKKRNNVLVRWKGRWKNKFGHIKRLKNKDTEIVVNSLFKDERVPKEVIELTIAHEIVHYMHGFNSPYEKKFKYPHQGGVVERELRDRGYNELVNFEKSWSKNEWPKILGERNNRDGVIRVKQLRSSFRFF